MSSYVDKVGMSSMSEDRTSRGLSFLGISSSKKSVSPRISTTRSPPLHSLSFLFSSSGQEGSGRHRDRQISCGHEQRQRVFRVEFAAQVGRPIQGENCTPPRSAGAPPRPHHGLTWQVTLPDAKQLRLSEDAVLHMRRILDEFTFACDGGISRGSTRQRLHQLLADFFNKFGSHVFRHPAWWQLASSRS